MDSVKCLLRVSFVLDSVYVQFGIICSLLCNIFIDTFEVDPHSIEYEERLVKPINPREREHGMIKWKVEIHALCFSC